ASGNPLQSRALPKKSMRLRPPRLRALALAATVLSGCGRLQRSAALHPYDSAPPSPAAPWTPPASAVPPPSPPRAVLPEPDHQQDLPDLIELALRNNPDTRRAWEEARAAAARLGRAEGAYLPKVRMTAVGGTSRVARAIPAGKEGIIGPGIQPDLALTWVLVDFGRRSADRARALQELRPTNYAFDRRLQTVVSNVQRSFFAVDAARASVGAAEATLEAARTVEAAASDRMGLGLATKPEVLLASQERYRSEYELTDAKGAVQRAHADLAANIGISPAEPLRVVDLSQEPLPPALPATVDDGMRAASPRGRRCPGAGPPRGPPAPPSPRTSPPCAPGTPRSVARARRSAPRPASPATRAASGVTSAGDRRSSSTSSPSRSTAPSST